MKAKRPTLFVLSLAIGLAVTLGGCRPSRSTVTPELPMPRPTATPPTATPKPPAPTATPASSAEPPEAIQFAVWQLASQLHLPGQVRLVRWEQVDWPNGCLGIPMRDACTEAVVPGYRIVVELDGQEVEYRSTLPDADPYRLLLAAGPDPGIEEPALVWERQEDDGCQSLLLAADGGAAIGPCDAPHALRPLLEEMDRPQQWADLLDRFLPFEAQTPWAWVKFQGRGQEAASPGWQRAVAAWARLVRQELHFGRSGASWGAAFGWRQEIPEGSGYCRFLRVEVYGFAYASTARCAGGDPRNLGSDWLEMGEWEQFDAWFYDRVPVYRQDLDFFGRGTQEMSEGEVEALRRWAEGLYSRLTGEASALTPAPLPSLGKLAYVQGGDIWVKTLPDGKARRLTTDGRNNTPRWSSSGQWLAFRKGEFAQVWVMRDDGSHAHSLMAVPDGAFAWSPVVDRLAYADGDRLKVVNAGDTDPTTLVAGPSVMPPSPPPPKVNSVRRIAWRPDGTSIAYEWTEQHMDQGLAYQGLWKVPAEGGEPVELYTSSVPQKGEAILAGWSLDGQHILFWQGDILSASMLADGVALYSLPAGGGQPIKLVDVVLVHDDFLASAPQGDRLAVTAGGYRATWTNKHVAVVEADGDTLTWLTDESVAAFSPAWSPDGVHLAYAAMADQGDLVGGEDARLGMMERRIWVVKAQDEPQLQQLTSDPAYRDERPLWSADRRHLLFARLDAEDRASLWFISPQGGDPQRVVEELTPLPGPAPGWFGYYGHVDWDQVFDWWHGPAGQ